MKPKKPEPVYIRDTSRMREYPPRSPAHWLFAVLLMTAVGGALWQHGHPVLTLSVLGAVPFAAAMVHIPYRWVDHLMRQIANCLIFGVTVWWITKRFNDKCADLVLVEALSIASLIFMAGGKPKDYFYLFFLSVFLLVYGALVPRLIHLYLFAAAAVLVLFIALTFRTSTLGGGPPVRETPPRRYRCWRSSSRSSGRGPASPLRTCGSVWPPLWPVKLPSRRGCRWTGRSSSPWRSGCSPGRSPTVPTAAR